MIKFFASLASLCVLLAPQCAGAVQLTNRDTTGYTLITVNLDGGDRQELKTSPSQVIDDICLKGCTITMPDGQEYEFEGDEIVSIEEGMIFLDGPIDSMESSDILDDGAEADPTAPNVAN